MRLRHVIIALLLFSSDQLLSQRYPFISYTPLDGLVSNRVRSMFQDSRGRLFFLSTAGLSVYDGARFNNYTTAEGLSQDVINDVLEITPDSFLIAVNTNKLNCLVGQRVHTIPTADGYCPVINSFFRSNGKLYLAADEGLFRIEHNRCIHMPINYGGKAEGEYIIDIKQVGKFFLLLVNPGLGPEAGTVYLYDPTSQEVLYKKSDCKTYQILTSPSGDLWLSTANGIRMLRKSELAQGIFNPVDLPVLYASIENETPLYMRFDKHGRLWISLNYRGVTLFQPNASIQYTEASGLSSNRVTFIFDDRESNHWFITEGAGAQKLVGSNIELIEHPFGASAIADFHIQRGTDSLWLTTDKGAQLMLVSGHNKKAFAVPHHSAYKGLMTTGSSILFEMDDEHTYQFHLPTKGNQLETVCEYNHGLTKGSYGALDHDGNLIVCTENALRVFFKDCSSFSQPFVDFSDQVCFDQRNLLWIITRSNKLIGFSVHPEDREHYLQLKYDLSSQLQLENPRSLMIDSSGRIWIGTRFDGLFGFRFDGKKLSLQYHLSKKNGLTDNFITFLTCDSTTIWAASAAGLDQITFSNNEALIDNITQANKMYISIIKVLRDKNGVVWALGEGGNMIKINPSLTSSIEPPKFFLSSIKAGQQSYSPSERNISFPYKQNDLTFFLAAPTFFDEKQIQYSYQLQGSGTSTQWSEPLTEPALHFVNLSPGKYTLRMKATFPAGRYPPQLLEYRFSISPPWWQAWWFTIIMVLIAIAIFVIIVRSYYRAKFARQKIALEKKQAVEKERTRIATDMHDDLGAGLSRIKYLSESIQFNQTTSDSVLNDVQKIASYSDEMVEKMGEIIWALNEKNDSIAHLIAFTRSYAMDYLTTNQIQCVFNAEEELPGTFVTGEMRRNIFLSVKESLHNVVKHAGAKTVTINVAIGPRLSVKIHDDGKGIDLNHLRPFSNGLSNIRKRMEEIGGKASFQSSGGTEVQLEVPLPE